MADNPQRPDDEKKKTEPINIKSGDKKSDTTRIDLSSAKPPPSITDKDKLPPDADDYFKRSTMRIETPESAGSKDETTKLDVTSAKKETTKLNIPSEKDKTSKLDMSDAAKSEDDVFKSKTIPVGIPTPPPKPAQPAKPKTISFKRPGAPKPGHDESIMVSEESTADATEQARKSETARIDLSTEDENRPATRPKTIRIKRPDGTSGKKALTITRPEEGDEAKAPMRVAPIVDDDKDTEDEPGVLVGVAAIAALLIVGVLLYVLLAQTLAPNLPFPGKI